MIIPATTLYNHPVTRKTQSKGDDSTGFTVRQRLALFFISWIGFLAIRIICATMKFQVTRDDCSAHNDVPESAWPPPRCIAPFWHRAVFPATFYYGRRGIAVMTSRSFDGEYIARIIEKFGFKAVRGSSSRGAISALLGMLDVVNANRIAAFTIDGPRGPRYVAKPGPVLLARKTGAPICCFYVAVDRAWVLKSWDAFVIPKPFSRAHIHWSAPIFVPSDASEAEQQEFQQSMQESLEHARLTAEERVLLK